MALFFAPLTLLVLATVLFLIVVPVLLVDDRLKGIAWTRKRWMLAVVAGILGSLVLALVLSSYVLESTGR